MDIIGFNEQIGFSVIPKIMIPKFKTMVPVAQKSVTQKAFDSVRAKGIVPVAQKSVTQKAFDSIRAKGIVPVAQKSVTQKAFDSVRAKKLMPKTAFNLVPTASKSFKPSLKAATVQQTMPIVKSEITQMEQSLQSLPAAKAAQAIFNLPPTPAVVQELTPVQRSFLKTDLPYKVISKNNFGQPTTKILKNTPLKFNIDIDQIQPPVDSGISNYYGK